MPYYRGDYYRGDWYRGDPGILGTLAKGALKIGGAVLGASPLGLAASAASSLIGPRKPVGSGIGTISIGKKVFEPLSALPGGRPFVRTAGAGGGGQAGYHLNKGRGARGEPPGSYYVRNRSMNPANAKALRRAVRRQSSFVALARRVLRGTGMTIKRSGFGTRKKGRR